MTSKALFANLLCMSLFTTSLALADDSPLEIKAAADVKAVPENAKAKEDCDTTPKVKPELDPKAIEQKAAEQKALENLGLASAPPVKVDPVVAAPAPKMETCK